MVTKQHIEITNKMYQCREQQIFLSGKEKFIKTYEKWSPAISKVMEAHNCSILEALIKLLDVAKDKPEAGMLMHVLTAVGCEMLEPSITAAG